MDASRRWTVGFLKHWMIGARFGLLALLLAVAGSVFGLDSQPALAAPNSIVASLAVPDTQNPGQTICQSPPVTVSSVVRIVGGAPATLCVWAKDVNHQPQGVGAFDVGVGYNASLATLKSLEPQTVWLGSTGRTVICSDVFMVAGLAKVGCSTNNDPPPYGPQGTGLIGKFTVSPLTTPGLTVLNLANESRLINTGDLQGSTVIPPEVIPGSVSNVNYRVAACADYNGDNTVRIPDIIQIVQHYGGNDAAFDLDVNGIVLIPDITIGVLEYGLNCPT
jgi:hypothetical protein